MHKYLLTIILVLAAVSVVYADEAVISHRVLTEDGVEIYYETQGEGIPILMIAGGPGGNPEFMKYTHKLWLAYGQLVFVHNRGRGLSQNLDSLGKTAYSVQTDILDLEAIRKDLKADKIIVYGHSYGGLPALLYSAEYPEHCLAVMTTGTLSGARAWQIQNIDGIKYFLQRHFPDEWKNIKELHDRGVLTSSDEYDDVWPSLTEVYYCNPDNAARMSAIWKDSQNDSIPAFNRNVYYSIVGDDPEWTVSGTVSGFEITDYLPQTTCPALIMGGRYDRVCPPLAQQEMAAAIADSRLRIFDKSGHRPFIEEPVLFFEITGEFLRTVIRTE